MSAARDISLEPQKVTSARGVDAATLQEADAPRVTQTGTPENTRPSSWRNRVYPGPIDARSRFAIAFGRDYLLFWNFFFRSMRAVHF
jgi:hypothetical protein